MPEQQIKSSQSGASQQYSSTAPSNATAPQTAGGNQVSLNANAPSYTPVGYYPHQTNVAFGPPIPAPVPANVMPVANDAQLIPFKMPQVCPVVFPNRYGRPGTVYYMNWNQVPPGAIPVPIKDSNGVYKTHFFIDIKEF